MKQRDKIQKIVAFKTWSKDKKIDALLEIDSNMYTNLGTDSKKYEREAVAKESLFIYKEIKKIDETLGKILLRTR